ncbi:MAG: hypothetical protein WDW38_009588 [Sanguina aurantia]
MTPYPQAPPVLHQIFLWSGPPGEQRGARTHYQQFTLNNQQYKLGDCVYLYPEDEALPHYIGKIKSAFVDSNYAQQDPHCIEVFELGDTDINPIGCISGKCAIIKARTYEEVSEAPAQIARPRDSTPPGSTSQTA